MEENVKNNTEDQPDKAENTPDFIQEFIERKKLQNRILQEIIDKLNENGVQNKSGKTKKNKKND